jgi:hypothetical protein
MNVRPIRRGVRLAVWGGCVMTAVLTQVAWADDSRAPVVLDSTGNAGGSPSAVVYDSENGVSGGAPATTYETAPFKDDRVTGPKGSRDTIIGLKPPKNSAPGRPATPATPATPARPAGDNSDANQPLPFVPYINVTPGQGGTSGHTGTGSGGRASGGGQGSGGQVSGGGQARPSSGGQQPPSAGRPSFSGATSGSVQPLMSGGPVSRSQ